MIAFDLVVMTPQEFSTAKRRLAVLRVAIKLYAIALTGVFALVYAHSVFMPVALAIAVVSALGCLYLFGVLAIALDKSVIVYVAGSVLGAPFSFFITYALLSVAAGRAGIT